jgi:hypothetical protein
VKKLKINKILKEFIDKQGEKIKKILNLNIR